MEQIDPRNDNNSDQGYATSTILKENLSGTQGKELSDDAKAQIKRFAFPIQCGMLGLATVFVTPIAYYLMKYLLNVKSVFASIAVAASYITILYLAKTKTKNPKILILIITHPIIFYLVFKYLFYMTYIQSLLVILTMSVGYTIFEIFTRHIVVKLKPCSYITETALLLLILIKYINGSINYMTIFATGIICLVVTITKLVIDMKTKSSFEKTYSGNII